MLHVACSHGACQHAGPTATADLGIKRCDLLRLCCALQLQGPIALRGVDQIVDQFFHERCAGCIQGVSVTEDLQLALKDEEFALLHGADWLRCSRLLF